MSTAPAPALPSVTFEVERFEWASDDRLEVVGRWFGLRGHRFLRPTLDVEVRGERRRMLAVLEHKPWAAEEGEEWVAAFAWPVSRRRSTGRAHGQPRPRGAASAPGRGRGRDRAAGRVRRSPPGEASADRRAGGRAGRGDGGGPRRDDELAQLRETHSEMTRELRERARTAQEKAKQLETELEKVRERVTAAEEEVESERRAAEEERRKQLDAMRAERDAATADRNRAEAEAEAARADRDDALRRATAAEAERDALVEARDRAREERNAWMSRARATAAESRGMAPIAERVPAPKPPAPPQDEPADPQVIPPPSIRAAHHPDRRTAGAASGRSPGPRSPAYA